VAYLTNCNTFYEMAEESYSAMELALKGSRSISADGKTMTEDGAKRNFASKQALIVIAFSAMHFEALVFIVAHQKLGMSAAQRLDRKLYEERLVALGCTNQSLIDQAKNLREMRKEMVHEKAIDLGSKPDLNSMNIRIAWDAAYQAISFIRELRSRLLGVSPPGIE